MNDNRVLDRLDIFIAFFTAIKFTGTSFFVVVEKDKTKKKKNNNEINMNCTYDASCSSIIDAFMTSRLTTGPIRMLAYCEHINKFMN